MSTKIGSKNALIMVDLQNDFCKGGSLHVPDGDAVIPLANKLQAYFEVVIATQDWHPQDHMSFAASHPNRKVGDQITVDNMLQVLWPVHCVQNSEGAQFHPDLDTHKINKIFHKGIDKKIDSYSAFFDNAHQRTTGLAEYLREEHIKDVYIMGLATDYCVKFSTIDAIHLGFKTHVIEDACRGVELNAGDVNDAFNEMRAAGAILIKSDDIPRVF